jgi:hypothetical protein
MATGRAIFQCQSLWVPIWLATQISPPALCADPPANADDFVLVHAADSGARSAQGRVETLVYPRTVDRKIAMLYPESRLTTTTEMANISVILPPVFETPGPRYGSFLECRLRVRVDDLPWRELAVATARSETIVAENLPKGKHTVTVEPVGGFAVVEAFRTTNKPMAGLWGTIVAKDYSELLTDVRADLFQGDRLVRTEHVRNPRSGGFEILGLRAGTYRLRIDAAGWIDATLADLKIEGPGDRLDVGGVALAREPRCGGRDGQDRPGPQFGNSVSVSPGGSFTAPVNLPATKIKRAKLRSRFKSIELAVSSSKKFPLGNWNDAGEATFQVPKDTPWDMYDLVLSFEMKQGDLERISGQAVCVRPPLPAEFHVAGCGHMNTWGQQTADYLARVADVAQLAGARTLLIANEVNAAYVSGGLSDLRIPYVVSRGNHTMARWGDFFGESSRAHDDGPMRIVDFGRWPYESWEEVHALFRNRPTATNRVVVCYEGFAPIALIREHKINLLFDGHSDVVPAGREALPPRTFHMRAPTQDTLRWIPMTHDGVASAIKANADVPVLSVPRTGPSPLRVAFEFPEDGSAGQQAATITNGFATEFPHARLRLVLRRGAYQVTGGMVLQAFDSDDGVQTVLDLEIRVAAKSSVAVRATPK